jgi:hypothetical protein
MELLKYKIHEKMLNKNEQLIRDIISNISLRHHSCSHYPDINNDIDFIFCVLFNDSFYMKRNKDLETFYTIVSLDNKKYSEMYLSVVFFM